MEKSWRKAYTTKVKLKIVSFAESEGNHAAARHFSISECNVRRWRNAKCSLLCMSKKKMNDRGRRCFYPALEEAVLQWVKDRRMQGISVSSTEIRVTALVLKPKFSEIPTSFKASYGWVQRFMARQDLSIRRRTTICQRLPADYEEKLTGFQRYIIRLRQMYGHDLAHIGNADQTPLTFDFPSNTTVDFKGEKSISIRTTGNEKNRFTVMLACTADGGKLPPFIIFKRKTLPKKLHFPRGVYVRAHPKGWMDEALAWEWLQRVWGPVTTQRSLLVLDAFRVHLMPSIKESLSKKKANLVIIPGAKNFTTIGRHCQ